MHSSATGSAMSDPLVDDIVVLLRKIVYVPDSDITAQTELAALGIDSLDLMEAGLELEALLDREVADDALTGARTVGDLARCFGVAPPRPTGGLPGWG